MKEEAKYSFVYVIFMFLDVRIF